MHFVSWQKKFRVLMLTNLDKKTYKYVIAKMFQDANGAICGPNANKLKNPEVLEIGVPFFTNISHIRNGVKFPYSGFLMCDLVIRL